MDASRDDPKGPDSARPWLRTTCVAITLAGVLYVLMPFVVPTPMAALGYLDSTRSQVGSIAACIHDNWDTLDQFLPADSVISAQRLPGIETYDIASQIGYKGTDTYGRPLVVYRLADASETPGITMMEVIAVGNAGPTVSSLGTPVVWRVAFDPVGDTYSVSDPIISLGTYRKKHHIHALLVITFALGCVLGGIGVARAARAAVHRRSDILPTIVAIVPIAAALAVMLMFWPTWRPRATSAPASELAFIALVVVSCFAVTWLRLAWKQARMCGVNANR